MIPQKKLLRRAEIDGREGNDILQTSISVPTVALRTVNLRQVIVLLPCLRCAANSMVPMVVLIGVQTPRTPCDWNVLPLRTRLKWPIE